jgi:photosystem II stability/assembly factor-like uncharacterized protein
VGVRDIILIGESRALYKLSMVLLLVLLGFSNVCASMHIENTAYRFEQTQTTTWISLESDYPEAKFKDVEFVNSSHGWVVGILYPDTFSGGVILYTENGGDTWETQLADDSQLFLQIDIVNERTAWVTGLGCLYFTNDSGASWHTSLVGSSRLSGMSTVEFLNATHGWTATSQVLYRTTDGGQSWQNVTGWTFDDNPNEMHFLTEDDVWAIGFDGIYHSKDGAETWEMVFDRGGWSLSFLSENEAWGISDNSLFHMGQNHTWEQLAVPGRAPSFRLRAPYSTDIQFIDEDHGWIVGSEIPVMHTADGGETWYQQSVPADIGNRMMAVCFIDETHGWAVGTDGCILRTSTGDSLDVLLFSDQQDLLLITIGAVAIAVAVPVTIVAIRWRRHRMHAVRREDTTGLTPDL